MKLLLIKAGKAAKTIRREGIVVGGKRVAKAFFSLFGRVGSGDILFVTGGVGDSALYRDWHCAEELELNGFKCSVTVQDNPFLTRYADRFNVFIFHRVLYYSRAKKLIEKAKELGKEIIFETDDLVFDTKYLKHMDYLKNINSWERKLYEDGVGTEILNDPYVKVCTTTTSFLKNKLEEYGKKVFLVPNKLSKSDVETCEKILKRKKPSHGKKIRLGYFSGTISHNKDFASITEALMKIMGKYPNVELFLVGPLDIENELNTCKERIKQLPFVPREKHFENNARVDINLAPLEIGNPFCEAKSELKFFEAGIVGTPTVASATQTFQKAIEDGVDGFVAANTEEWFAKLEKLILDENLRRTMGERAREKTLEKYTTENARNDEYYSFLQERVHASANRLDKEGPSNKLVGQALSRITIGGKDAGKNYHKWYYHSKVWKTTKFLGIETMKSVSDLWNYQEIISEIKPSLIIEFGTNRGGSAIFFSLVLNEVNSHGKVFTVEVDGGIVDPSVKKYSNIDLMIGSSISKESKDRIRQLVKEYPGKIFAILDSDHSKKHVLAEMEFLREFLKEGDYLVVEDSNINGHPVFPGWGEGPYEAIQEYFRKYPNDYTLDKKREYKFGFTFSPKGFLMRR